jgi:predicted O-methyltransferase YrrM
VLACPNGTTKASYLPHHFFGEGIVSSQIDVAEQQCYYFSAAQIRKRIWFGRFRREESLAMIDFPLMSDTTNIPEPPHLQAIIADSRAIGFALECDALTGCLLRTLAASKPAGAFLELGTGTGVSMAWLRAGMTPDARLLSADINAAHQAVARRYHGDDPRVTFVTGSAEPLVQSAEKASFDLIFADCWIGKHHLLGETLDLLKRGGIYLVDDMLPMHGWGPDQPRLVAKQIAALEQRDDIFLTKFNWSVGLIMCVKR